MTGPSVRTGKVYPTYQQKGMGYYLQRTLEMARRAHTEPDTLAHYTHRFTGLVIAFYIFAHISVISKAAYDGESFNEIMDTFHTPLFLMLDWLLWGAVSFHAFNGFRLILFDYEILIDKHDRLVWVVIAATLLSMALGFIIISPEVLA